MAAAMTPLPIPGRSDRGVLDAYPHAKHLENTQLWSEYGSFGNGANFDT